MKGAQISEDIERLVTEIDMLKYLLFLVKWRNVAAEEEMRPSEEKEMRANRRLKTA
jgi:hypothetical protein